MNLSNPKNISFRISSIVFFIMILVLFLLNIEALNNNFFQTILILLISFILIFTVIYYFIRRYIFDRVKVIYKSIRRQKGTSEFIESDLDKVSNDVELISSERDKEIDNLKMTESFRREFLGNVSHELKTPIFNIQGYIHTLIDGALYDEKVNMQYLNRTSKSVDRMINIVEDLEMISKIESDKLELEFNNINIVALTQEVFDQVEIKAKRRSVNLKFEKEFEPIIVSADREKITQVMTNLIDNSIKYGKEGGSTEVRFYEMGDNILVEISDNGIGISESNLSRLFERFYRVDKSRSREQGGTGLGLAIVKHILEAHKQNINVRSTEGIGTTFSFTLQKS